MRRKTLDDRPATGKIDRENMLQVLEETPETYERAYTAAMKSDTLPHALPRPTSNLALIGMGGSAISADILKDWLFSSQIPIETVRGSQLPGSITAETCALVASYSGQTAETLRALREARERKSRIACIASGGELITIGRESGLPHVQVRSGLQPREALPDLLAASMAVLVKWGICNDESVLVELRTVGEQLGVLRKKIGFQRPHARNPAKQLAVKLHDTIPFIYTAQLLAAAGRRFKNQLNENSKVLAKFEALPEMLHNEVQSWQMLREDSYADCVSFVLLRGCEANDETEKFDRLAPLIRQAGSRKVHVISLKFPTRLATVLGTIYFCDYVSFYLAILRGIDPTPITTIQTLKRSARASGS